MAAVALAKAAGSERWNRLRRFERVRDKFQNDAPTCPEPVEGHDPEQVTGEITESPGGATSNGAAGVRRGLFQHGA